MDNGLALGEHISDVQHAAYINLNVKTQVKNGKKSHMVLVDYPIRLKRTRPAEFVRQNPKLYKRFNGFAPDGPFAGSRFFG